MCNIGQALMSLGQGYNQSTADKFSASIAQGNETLALGQGQLAAAQGALQIGRVATAANSTIASQRARYGSVGLNPDFGSPLLTQTQSFMQGQGDMNIVAARTAAGQASAAAAAASAAGQVASLNIKASSDLMSGYLGAATAMLSGPAGGSGNGQAFWPWQAGGGGGASVVGQIGSSVMSGASSAASSIGTLFSALFAA